MELGEFAEEIIRYSFLLGSALRNEDEEQFVEIYDTIVPKTLTKDQIEGIKDTARSVADLDEDEYNELVVRARDFSLAQSSWALTMIKSNEALQSVSSPSSISLGSSPSTHSDLKNINMEDEFSSSRLAKPSMESLARTSRHFGSAGSCGTKSGDFDTIEDGDSGVFNSSKNTAGSISDHDLTDTCESRVGAFDYYSQDSIVEGGHETLPRCTSSSSLEDCSQEVFRDRHTSQWSSCRSEREQERLNEQAYDAAFDADTDIDCQLQSDKKTQPPKKEIEMKTFVPKTYNLEELMKNKKQINDFIKQKHTDTYDEAHSYDSDNSCEDLQSVVVDPAGTSEWNMHKSLYSRPECFARIDNDMEYHEDDSQFGSNPPHKNHFTSSDGPGENKPFFQSLHSYGAPRNYGPYGGSRSVDSRVTFPLGSSTSRNTSSDGVKIDKTVKSRDNSEPPFGDPANKGKLYKSIGNLLDNRHSSYRSESISNLPPAEVIQSRGSSLEDPDTIKKDKKKKKKKKDKDNGEEEDENGNPIQKPFYDAASKFPRELNHLSSYSRDTDDMPSALDTQQSKKMRRRKRKEDSTIKAETVPGHIGHKSVSELLSFIDGSGMSSDNNHHKKAHHHTNNSHQEVGHEKPIMVSTASVILENNKSDVHSALQESMPVAHVKPTTENNKSKKKKKTKNGIKPSAEIDGKSLRATDTDKDVISESSSEFKDNDQNNRKSSNKRVSSLDEDNRPALSLNDFTSKEYIFTDFDTNVLKEEQFTVVSKKKKKSSTSTTKEFSRDFMPEAKKEEVPFRRRSRPHQRSFTPPPIASSSTIQDKTSERSLSPSAFPVLSNSREARRNSTGNVSELGFYDSDHDSSVKSVPVIGSASDPAKQGNDVSTAGSKPPPISYASIAAGSKTLQNGVGSSSASSQDEDQATITNSHTGLAPSNTIEAYSGDITPEESGSPNLTGDNNSDELNNCVDMVLEDCSKLVSSSSSTAVCTTTELSHPGQYSNASPVGTSISKKDTAVEAHTDCSVFSTNPKTPSESLVEVEDPTASTGSSEQTKPSHSANEVVVSLNVNDNSDFPALAQASSVPPSHKKLSKHSDVLNNPLPTQPVSSSVTKTNNYVRMDNNAQHPVVSSGSTKTTESSITSSGKLRPTRPAPPPPTIKGASAKPPQAPRITSVKSKSRASKSVVFLDKKMNEGPKNLDISFGFEPDLENVIISARLDSSSTCSSDSGRGTDNDSFTPITIVDSKGKSDNGESSTGVVDNPVARVGGIMKYQISGLHSGDNNHKSELVFMSEQTDISKQSATHTTDDKQKIKVMAPINGVVLSPKISVSDLPPSEALEDVMAEISDDNLAEPHHTEPEAEHKDSSVKTLHQSTSKGSMYERSSDPNFQAGQFNHEAGVAFLYTDWQKINHLATVYAEA